MTATEKDQVKKNRKRVIIYGLFSFIVFLTLLIYAADIEQFAIRVASVSFLVLSFCLGSIFIIKTNRPLD